MQGSPIEETSNLSTDAGNITQYDHVLQLKDPRTQRSVAYFSVAYADYPPGSTRNLDPNEFLEKCWQGSFAKIATNLISKEKITLDGYPGLSFRYTGEAKSGIVTGRHFLVNDRLYILVTIMTQARLDRGGSDKFLNSFHILPAERETPR